MLDFSPLFLRIFEKLTFSDERIGDNLILQGIFSNKKGRPVCFVRSACLAWINNGEIFYV